MSRNALSLAFIAALLAAPGLYGQEQNFPPDPGYVPGSEGSRNIKVMSHIPLGRMFTMTDVEVEQELSRPYAYVSRMHGTNQSAGFNIISIKNPEKAQNIYYWRIDKPELHRGMGGMAPMYLKSKGRYYFTQSFQWAAGSIDADLGAVVFDVTGLPDTSKVKEVARIHLPENPGGFHESFSYKHSNGEALVFFQVSGPFAAVYDIDQVVANAPNKGLVAKVPVPEMAGQSPLRGYHDFYVGYDPANHRDVFYGAGAGGYHIYDITDLQNIKLIAEITGVAGVGGGHTFTPDPTGRYAVAETEYQYAPLRIFDIKPALDGTVKAISRPIGAWTARWKGLAHNHEVRWPYVFVSGYEDGLQVFNMMDPTNPYTVAYYDTYGGPNQRGWGGVDNPEGGNGVTSGAFGIDVRNADGLILIADFHTGFWAFHMDGFDGWNGHQWGMPNISSAQDWDNGPEGSKPNKTS
jgi:hypothetical protein